MYKTKTKPEYYKRALEASCFPVKKVQVAENRFNIINAENGQKLSEVSKRYTLVKNIDIFEPFIKEFGYEAIHKFYGYGNSKYYHMEIKTGRRFNFGTEEKPDVIDEMLVIGNSYNKTKSFTFRLGAFRWVCSNGLYSGKAIVNYRKIHVGNIPTQKLIFKTLLKYQDNTFDNWEKLKNTPLNKEKRLEIIDNMKLFDEVNAKGKEILSNRQLNNRIKNNAKYMVNYNRNELDNQENGWGLYNQINFAIDSILKGKSQVDRKIKANNEMEKYLLKVS